MDWYVVVVKSSSSSSSVFKCAVNVFRTVSISNCDVKCRLFISINSIHASTVLKQHFRNVSVSSPSGVVKYRVFETMMIVSDTKTMLLLVDRERERERGKKETL